jgi:hypothetical protein
MIERFKWPLLLRVLGLLHQGAELPGVAVLRVRKIPFRVFPSNLLFQGKEVAYRSATQTSAEIRQGNNAILVMVSGTFWISVLLLDRTTE